MLDSLIFIYITCFTIQAFYWLLLFWQKIDIKKNTNIEPTVSVIICAKNELKNLKKNINSWLTQNYNANWELIIVNDNSEDETADFLKTINNNKLRVITAAPNPFFAGGKKNALTQGIEQAKNDFILLTDADCVLTPNWIKIMLSQLTTHKEIVLGYGPIIAQNTLLNKMVRWETILTAIQYFSYTIMGLPYMGVGRNLGYNKELFTNANGFNKHKSIGSGDDDLFIQQNATKLNTAICVNEESFAFSASPQSFKAWFKQKKRHYSTSSEYKLLHKILLGLFSLSYVLFWIMAIMIFFFNIKISFLFIIMRWLFISFSFIRFNQYLKEKNILFFIPLLDFFTFIYYFIFSVTLFTTKKQTWK